MKHATVAHTWRAILSACLVASSLLLGASEAFGQQKAQKVPAEFNIVSVRISNVILQNGQLFADGFVGNTPFKQLVPINLSTPGAMTNSTGANGAACPILNLELGAISLDVLGLLVETSDICLKVTAYEGEGLLGDLLCEIAQLLQGGATVGGALGALDPAELTTVLQGIEDLLNEALEVVTSNTITARGGGMRASCTVLDLSLGPVELTLLGLEVILDNCAGGPVTVTITAIPGGGLLGDLLCSLSDVLQGPRPNPTAVQALLWQITRVLVGLLR